MRPYEFYKPPTTTPQPYTAGGGWDGEGRVGRRGRWPGRRGRWPGPWGRWPGRREPWPGRRGQHVANAMGHHGPSLLGHSCEEPRCIQCQACLATSFNTRTPTLAKQILILTGWQHGFDLLLNLARPVEGVAAPAAAHAIIIDCMDEASELILDDLFDY